MQHASCRRSNKGASKSMPWTHQVTPTRLKLKAVCLHFLTQAFCQGFGGPVRLKDGSSTASMLAMPYAAATRVPDA